MPLATPDRVIDELAACVALAGAGHVTRLDVLVAAALLQDTGELAADVLTLASAMARAGCQAPGVMSARARATGRSRTSTRSPPTCATNCPEETRRCAPSPAHTGPMTLSTVTEFSAANRPWLALALLVSVLLLAWVDRLRRRAAATAQRDEPAGDARD